MTTNHQLTDTTNTEEITMPDTTTDTNPELRKLAGHIRTDVREWTTNARPASWDVSEFADYELVMRVVHECQGDPAVCGDRCELIVGSVEIDPENPEFRDGTAGGIKAGRIPELIAVLQDYVTYKDPTTA